MKITLPKLSDTVSEQEAIDYIAMLKPIISTAGRACFPQLKKIYAFAIEHNRVNIQKECLILFLSVYALQRVISREAISWAKASEQFLEQNADTAAMAELHLQLMPFYLYSDKLEKAKEHYFAAIELVSIGSSLQENTRLSDIIRLRGVQFFMEIEEYELAWQELFALENDNASVLQKWNIHEQENSTVPIIKLHLCQRICIMSASIFIRFGDLIVAEAYLKLATQLSKVAKDSTAQYMIHCLYGDIYLAKHDIEKAHTVAEELLKDYTVTKSFLSAIQGNKILAFIARNQADLDKALFYAETTYSFARHGKDKLLRVHPTLLLAEMLLTTNKDLQRAKVLFESVRPFFQQRRFRMLTKNYCYVGLLLAEKFNDTSHLKEYTDKLLSAERYNISPVQRGRFYEAKAMQKASFLDSPISEATAIGVHKKIKHTHAEQHSSASVHAVSYDNIELSRALKTLIANISEHTVLGTQRSFIQKLQQLLEMLEQNTATSAMIQAVEHEIQRSQEVFLRQLARLCPSLTHSELKICIYLRLNLGTHDIANLLSISPDTVYTHRKRIRKKLAISNRVSLHIYLLRIQQEA